MLFADYSRWSRNPPSWLRILASLAAHPGMLAAVFLRTQQVLVRRGQTRLAWSMRSLSTMLTGADFVPGCEVGAGISITHPVGIVIGSGVTIGDNATFA